MENVEQTSALKLILAWSVAGVPLLAGVIQTLLNAMKLFQ
ncbi:MAG: MFS transporter small subunit [Afipia sp.]